MTAVEKKANELAAAKALLEAQTETATETIIPEASVKQFSVVTNQPLESGNGYDYVINGVKTSIYPRNNYVAGDTVILQGKYSAKGNLYYTDANKIASFVDSSVTEITADSITGSLTLDL